MYENLQNDKRSFLPSGPGWIIVGGLALIIAGAIFYMPYKIQHNKEQLLANLAAQGGAGSGSMRAPAPSFDLDPASVPKDQILSGGPPKDGIPALTNPKMNSANEADYLRPNDRVVGVVYGGKAMAYPLRILESHEAVNDSAGDTHFAVTYCPLCESVTVFDREVKEGEIAEFGISGMLYNSNVLLYDRQKNPDKESLWSQMKTQGVTGKSNQEQLKVLPYKLTSWEEWKQMHPDTLVLSTDTGYQRHYGGNIYQAYFESKGLMFPINHQDDRLPLKSRVVGVKIGDKARAYPIDVIKKEGGIIQDTLNGKTIEIKLAKNGTDAYLTKFPEEATVINSFWFAWAAFNQGTEIYGKS